MNNTIEVYQGNTKTIQVSLTNDGSPFLLDGYTCQFAVKANKYDTELLIDIEAAVGDITDNTVIFTLSSANTLVDVGSYYYEVFISNVDPAFAKTVASGIFSVMGSLVATIETIE